MSKYQILKGNYEGLKFTLDDLQSFSVTDSNELFLGIFNSDLRTGIYIKEDHAQFLINNFKEVSEENTLAVLNKLTEWGFVVSSAVKYH